MLIQMCASIAVLAVFELCVSIAQYVIVLAVVVEEVKKSSAPFV
jgi:hypothetical protein